MRTLTFCFLNIMLILGLNVNANADEHSAKIIKAMQTDGHILMMRHANAPGYGDPDNIKIGDCNTQRNLDERGRTQSIKIGEWLRSNNIKPSAVYSSQWCRCLETAKLLGFDSVEELNSLNSFFQMTQNRESNLRNLKQTISAQSADKGLIIMVTHSVTISAISGLSVASGDGVLLKINNSKPYEVVASITMKKD